MNSTTKIIAGVAVLALLFAGIGFAAVTYTAQTDSTDNEIGVAYITVNQGHGNADLIGDNSGIILNTTTDVDGNVTYTNNGSAINEGKIYLKNGGSEATTVTVEITCTSSQTFALDLKYGTQTISKIDNKWTISNIALGVDDTATTDVDESVTELTVQFALPSTIDETTAASLGGTYEFHITASAETSIGEA